MIPSQSIRLCNPRGLWTQPAGSYPDILMSRFRPRPIDLHSEQFPRDHILKTLSNLDSQLNLTWLNDCAYGPEWSKGLSRGRTVHWSPPTHPVHMAAVAPSRGCCTAAHSHLRGKGHCWVTLDTHHISERWVWHHSHHPKASGMCLGVPLWELSARTHWTLG